MLQHRRRGTTKRSRVAEGLRANPQAPGARKRGGPLGFREPAAAWKRPQHTSLYSWIGVLSPYAPRRRQWD